MKWNALATASDERVLQSDWEAAEKIEFVRAGEKWLFKKGVFGVSYIPYSDIRWAYRRIETVNGKLCCGRAVFDIHYVRIVFMNGKEFNLRFEEKKAPQQLLDVIAERNPKTEIGYSEEKKAKYA